MNHVFLKFLSSVLLILPFGTLIYIWATFTVNRYCIANGVEDTTSDRVLRLNLNAHPLSYINDQDMGTTWLSKIMTTQDPDEGLTLTVDLVNGQYQVTHTHTRIYSHTSDRQMDRWALQVRNTITDL